LPYILLNNNNGNLLNTNEWKGFWAGSGTPSDDSKRLTFLVHERLDNIGGVQRHSTRLAEALSSNYAIDRLNWKNGENTLPLNFPMLRFQLKKSTAQIIYCDDGLSSIVGTRIGGNSGKKLVATLHGLDTIAKIPGYQKLIKRSLHRLDKIVCVSRATALKAIARGADSKKIEIIPNAAEPVKEQIPRSDELFDKIRQLTGMDLAGKKVLFSLGRPVKRKGFDRFIEKVLPRLPEDYVYVVAGPKPQSSGFLQILNLILPKQTRYNLQIALGNYSIHEKLVRLSSHPRVFYLNGVSDYLRNLLYAAADLFIMPNMTVPGDMEGFGIVALEASVRGVPVIATGIEGIVDAVKDDRNGYCIAEGDYQGMARTILSLGEHSDRRLVLNNRAREFVLREFSIESIAAKYDRLFQNLIENNKGKIGKRVASPHESGQK